MIKLNLGCGNYPKPGWLNCDKRGSYQRWEYAPFADEIVELDLVKVPYSFADCSVDLITISHCLNQIEENYLPGIMRELYRILKPGGTVRITDDDVESPTSSVFKLPHCHALWYTGPKKMCQFMQEAKFRTHVLDKTATLADDKSILVSNHPGLPDSALFFVEGIKPNQHTQLAEQAAQLQQVLSDALRYFLHVSVAGFGGWCRVAGQRRLAAEPLTKLIQAFETVGIPRCRWPKQETDRVISKEHFAETLGLGYRLWEDILQQEDRGATEQAHIPLGQAYQRWASEGGSGRQYWPVHSLRRLLGQKGDEFFRRGVVHGSVGTLDDTPGFSDLDLAFIIRSSVLKNEGSLLRLRELAARILSFTYAFDPFMHHGPYWLTEIDLAWYPEAAFPSVLFGYAVDLLDGCEELEIHVRPSEDVTDQLLSRFERFFAGWPSNPFVLKDSYDVEWVLGSTMFLPALYLQRRTGRFRYKRDTFPLAEKDFSRDQWEAVRVATELRAALGSRPKPSRWLVRVAGRLGVPGVLQRRARRNQKSIVRAQQAADVLGAGYPQRVVHLIKAMKSKLTTASGARVARTDDTSPDTNCFDSIPQGPLTNLPAYVPRERYDAAIDLVVSHWSSLPRCPAAIYQIGDIGAPGLSDLDFVVIFSGSKAIDWEQYQGRVFPEWVQQLMTHPPYCCTEAAWSGLPAWFPVFHMRHLWGKKLAEPYISGELMPGCALGMLVDYLLAKIPRGVIWYARRRPLAVHTLVAMLHSLKHTFKLAEHAGVTVPESAAQVISRTDTLRASWFELADPERLEMLARSCNMATGAAGELIRNVDQTIANSMGHGDSGPISQHTVGNQEDFLRFASPWSFEQVKQLALEYFMQTGKDMWVSPLSFLQILAVYAEHDAEFGKYLVSRGCQIRRQWDGGIWGDGLRYHVKGMMAYSRSAAILGVPVQKYVALGYSRPVPMWLWARRNMMRVLKREVGVRNIIQKMARRAKTVLATR
jgi:SAM-dependent methyltransferase